MMKLTNVYLIGLLTAGLLVGCGGDSDTTEVIETAETTEEVAIVGTDDTPTQVTSTITFSNNVMAVLDARCENCHGSNGNFTVTTAAMTYANIMALPGGANYMLGKGNNDIAHGGGDALDDAQYATIKAWIDAGAMNN